MSKSISVLKSEASQVTTAGRKENTKERVGGLFTDIIEYMEDNEADTPNISMTAQVDSTSGTPSVQVSKSGPNDNPIFNLFFSGLKGVKGDKGEKGEPGDSASAVQSDWNETDSSKASFIKNKPALKTVATTGSYDDLTDKPSLFNGSYANLTNKPNLVSGSTTKSIDCTVYIKKINGQSLIGTSSSDEITIEGGGSITVDSAFSKNSTNALQNKVLTEVVALKDYNSSNHTGLGIKLLVPNSSYTIGNGDFDVANTIYIIKYDFTLSGNVSVPQGCVLRFEGGSLRGNNRIITGNHTVIEASPTQIFDPTITLAGTWTITEVYPEWWGAKGDGVTNCTVAFQKAVNFAKTSGTVKVPMGEYLLDTVEFDGCQGLNFEGSGRECTILTMNTPLPVIKFVNNVSEKCNIGNFSIKPAANGTLSNENNVGIYYTKARQCCFHDMGFVKNGWGQLYAFVYIWGDFVYRCSIERFYISATDPQGLNRGGIKYCIKTKTGTVGGIAANLVIRDCQFYGIVNCEAAIDLSDCNGFVVENCNIEEGCNYALILGSRGLVQGNWFESQVTAPLLFQNNIGHVVSSFITFISNVFYSSNPMVVPEYCDNIAIVPGNTFFGSQIVKGENTINVEGLSVVQPTLTLSYKPEEITIDGETITYNAGVWHLEYTVSGELEYPLLFNVTTTSTANIKRINASAQDIWNNRYITGCSASGNRVMLDYKGSITRLMVDVEFC